MVDSVQAAVSTKSYMYIKWTFCGWILEKGHFVRPRCKQDLLLLHIQGETSREILLYAGPFVMGLSREPCFDGTYV
jgi:hypothetical protein